MKGTGQHCLFYAVFIRGSVLKAWTRTPQTTYTTTKILDEKKKKKNKILDEIVGTKEKTESLQMNPLVAS